MEQKKKYLYETHTHTAEASPCALVYAKDAICEYKERGYDGVIITDHVGSWGFSSIIGTWSQKVDNFIRAYENAKEEGDKQGVNVLFGAEIALSPPYRDYLVYGLKPDFFYKHENLHYLHLYELSELVHSEGAMIFAAHPFRGNSGPPEAEFLDGAEAFNGNPRHESRNHKAKKWAEKNGLIKISGSDYHEYGDMCSGILLNRNPKDMSELIEIIKSGEYELNV